MPALLRLVAIALAAGLCFLFFLHLGFPYDRLAGPVAERLGNATASEIRIARLAPRLSLHGPGLHAQDVTAIPQGGRPIQLERVFLRPAWSAAWLRGDPALHVELGGVELADLPLAAALPGVALTGRAEIGLDLVPGQATSQASFDARDGSLALPGLPLALPFTSFEGELRYDGAGESLLEVEEASLTGPLVSLEMSGTVTRGASLETSPLRFDLEITAQPELRGTLQAAGIALSPEGKGKLQLTGTPSRPELR